MSVLECSINDIIIVNEAGRGLFREGMRLCLSENVGLIYEDVVDVLGIVDMVVIKRTRANYYDIHEKYFCNIFEQKTLSTTSKKRVDFYDTLQNHFSNGFENGATFSTDIRDIVMSKCNNLNLELIFKETYKDFYAVRNIIKDVVSERYGLTDEAKEGMLVSGLNRNEIVIESNFLLGVEYKKSVDAFIGWANKSVYGKAFNPIS